MTWQSLGVMQRCIRVRCLPSPIYRLRVQCNPETSVPCARRQRPFSMPTVRRAWDYVASYTYALRSHRSAAQLASSGSPRLRFTTTPPHNDGCARLRCSSGICLCCQQDMCQIWLATRATAHASLIKAQSVLQAKSDEAEYAGIIIVTDPGKTSRVATHRRRNSGISPLLRGHNKSACAPAIPSKKQLFITKSA